MSDNLSNGLTEKKGFTPEKSAPDRTEKTQRAKKEGESAGSKSGKSFKFA